MRDPLLASRHEPRFTLIELLVVIAIIAILAAMLLPGLSAAKNLAKRSLCLSSFKQIGIGVFGYVDDYSGWMPVSSCPLGSPRNWKQEVAPYLGMNTDHITIGTKVFRCPTWSIPPDLLGHTDLYGGYGWNIGSSANHDYGFGYNDPGLYGNEKRVPLNSATSPSQSIVCGEATDWETPPASFWDYAYVYLPSALAPTPPVGNRHGGGINMLWADGHGEWMRQSALRSGANGDINWYYKRIR